MTNPVRQAIESRVSVLAFDPDRPIADSQLSELLRLATLAPSAYHFQNWKFVVVRTPGAKLRFRGVANARETHALNPVLQRDEAFRSASLASMTLMLAAQGMSLATCPMGGFDPHGLSREFGLTATEIPVMLVAIGYPLAGAQRQKPRRALQEVATFI